MLGLCAYLFAFLFHLRVTWSLPAFPERDLSSSMQNKVAVHTNDTSAAPDGSFLLPPRFDDLVDSRMDVLRQNWQDVETIAVEGRSLSGPSRAPWAYKAIFMKLFDPTTNTVFTTSTVPDSGNPPQWTAPNPIAPRPGQQLQPWEWGSDEMTLAQAFRIVDTGLGEQEPWRRIWKGKFRPLRARFPDQVYYLFSTALERPGNVMVGVQDERVYQRNSLASLTLPGGLNYIDDDDEMIMSYVESSEWVPLGTPAATVATS